MNEKIVDILCSLHYHHEPWTKEEILARIERLKADTKFKFAYQQERWITAGDGQECPLCVWLSQLGDNKDGWVPYGSLPPYRKAHSTFVGWKASNSSCRCVKGYRRAKGESPGAIDVVEINPHS